MLDLLFLTVERVSWRWLLQVALLSLGLTLGCRWGFRGDSLSRRSLGVAAVWLLALVPLVLLVWQPRYQIGVFNPPDLPALTGIPLVLLVAWLLAALAGAAAVLMSVVHTTRALRRLPALNLTSSAGSVVQKMNETFCQRLNIAPPAIVSGDRCCASSIGQARLVVPANFCTWPVTAQRSVIAHELVHLNRRDDRFMLALQLLARCYVFCPWLYLLYERFVFALEEACDERAAELTGSRSLYLEGLAEAALLDGGGDYDRPVRDESNQTQIPVATLINAQHKNSFMQRLKRLLGEQQFFEVQSGALAAGMGIGLFVLTAFTTFEFVEVPKRSALVGSERLQLTVMSAGSSSSHNAARIMSRSGPEVDVVTRLPDALASKEERITPAVIYPGRALIEGVEGEVLVEFGIAADGTTVQPHVVRSTHPTYLNRAAIRAVQQTVYHTHYNNYQNNNYQNTGFSGVTTAQDLARTGGLLAVRTKRPNKAQKLFLFRLNADD